jgi:GNAT superfamily N-acetyltransferase
VYLDRLADWEHDPPVPFGFRSRLDSPVESYGTHRVRQDTRQNQSEFTACIASFTAGICSGTASAPTRRPLSGRRPNGVRLSEPNDVEGVVSAVLYRPAELGDTRETPGIFLAAINELYARRGIPLLEGERGERSPLHQHWLTNDAARFWVAERDGRLVGFACGIERPGRRGPWWFLSSLFVVPEAQGEGVGRALFECAASGRDPRGLAVTIADALQPVSVTLYARQGMLPRLPLIVFGGRPRPMREAAGRPAGGGLPMSGRATPGRPTSRGRAVAISRRPVERTQAALARLRDLDLAVTGVDRTIDHAYLLDGRRECRLLVGAEGPTGYVYVSPSGSIGPGAALKPADVAELTGWALRRAVELGAERISAIVPGTNQAAQQVCWAAGLHSEAAMGVLLASRRFGRFDRYLVGSFGLM